MSDRLQRLFEFYSADLARFAPTLKGAFGCPLCYQVIAPPPRLSDVVAEEHVIPSALGGRIITLTCKKCNNDHGRDLDAHMIQRVRVEAHKRPLRTRMYVGHGEQGVELRLPKSEGDPFQILGIPKQSDPKKVKEAMELLRDGQEIRLQINFGYNPQKSVVALLRSAYLLMFRYFGYRYVLDPSAKPLHWQIQHPLETTAVLNSTMWRSLVPLPITNQVCIVKEPRDFRGFLVTIQLDGHTKHHAGVALPPPGGDGEGLYKALDARPADAGSWQLVPLRLIPRQFRPLIELWNYHTKPI